jgi:excisionase family DNA binding protein
LNKEIIQLNDKKLCFLNTKEVASALNCSIPTARQLFHRPDFPALKVGKNFRVEKSALEKWASERRV